MAYVLVMRKPKFYTSKGDVRINVTRQATSNRSGCGCGYGAAKGVRGEGCSRAFATATDAADRQPDGPLWPTRLNVMSFVFGAPTALFQSDIEVRGDRLSMLFLYTLLVRLFTMITNIDIDDSVVADAMLLTGARTKREVVDRALREMVARARRPSIRALFGIGGVDPDYDPKAPSARADEVGQFRVEQARAPYAVGEQAGSPAKRATVAASPRISAVAATGRKR